MTAPRPPYRVLDARTARVLSALGALDGPRVCLTCGRVFQLYPCDYPYPWPDCPRCRATGPTRKEPNP